MGKRERRRRREQLAGHPQLTPLPHRLDVRQVYVRIAGPSLTRPLVDLVQRAADAQAAVDTEVDRLVTAGVGWPTIADALGVTRQAARQRWLRRRS